MVQNVPEGNWYCPKCRCGVCRDRDASEEEVSMAVCRQCEHRCKQKIITLSHGCTVGCMVANHVHMAEKKLIKC